MRVVWLTHNFPRAAGDLSGGFLVPLARALGAAGVGVRVIAPADRGATGDAELEGVAVQRVRYADPAHERLAYDGRFARAALHPAGWRALAGLVGALRAAARAALRDGADLVHAHWWVPAGLAAPPEAPLVVTLHGTDVRLLGRTPGAAWLARRVLRRAAVVSAVSQPLAARLARRTGVTVPADRVQPMPVDLGAWRWSRGGGGVVLVTRLVPQKRVHLALEALAALATLGVRPPLTIVGDGPLAAPLRARAAALGVAERVRWQPRLARGAIADLLADADLALAPSREEGLGLAAAEALAAGVPVVACTDGGGLLEVVATPEAGRVVKPDARALARAMADLLADGGARARARGPGDAWRQRLDPGAAAERHRRWYEAAVAGRRALYSAP